MADFFLWALAIEQVAGWAPGTIAAAYADQRAAGDVDAMEDDAVVAIRSLLKDKAEWRGSATDLLIALRSLPGPARSLPRSAAKLGSELARIAPLLERNGITVRHERQASARTIILKPQAPSLLLSPSLSAAPASLGLNTKEVPRDSDVSAASSASANHDGNDSSDGARSVAEFVDLSAFAEPDETSESEPPTDHLEQVGDDTGGQTSGPPELEPNTADDLSVGESEFEGVRPPRLRPRLQGVLPALGDEEGEAWSDGVLE